ncbi:724_t:CDS:1, partial [Paraglomus occultum]
MDILGRKVRTAFQNGDLQPGNTIAITNIRFARNRAEITSNNELWIGKSYDEIQVISSTNPPSNSSSPDSPPPPTFFPEVGQENQELNQEENKMALLAEELLRVIEDNNQICQEAQNFGVKLPEIPSDALNYFQEEFFTLLDENQPLNSSHNSQINTENENIRKKKLNIKENIYGISNNNKRKLTEKKAGQTASPKNELEKLKEEAKERINQILTDKDNLRNINLTTLAKGKYQNWEKDIEGLTSEKEVLAYVEDFLSSLKETGAEEKEKDKNNKVNSNKFRV